MKLYTNDLMIRNALEKRLLITRKNDPSTIIIPEVEICMGFARADIMMVNGILHGFEIKSDRDTLERLKHQVGYYEQVFEKITIVVGEKYSDEVQKIVPDYWGIVVASFFKNEKVKLSNIQIAKKNKFIDPYSLVQMLWKNEVLEELDKRGLSKGYKSKSKNILWERLVNNLSHKELLEMVKEKLKSRNRWRTVEQQE